MPIQSIHPAASVKENMYSNLSVSSLVNSSEMDIDTNQSSGKSKPLSSTARKSPRLNPTTPYARVEQTTQPEIFANAQLIEENNNLRKEIGIINEKLSDLLETFNKKMAEKDEIIKRLLERINPSSTPTTTIPPTPTTIPPTPTNSIPNQVTITPLSPVPSPIKKRPKLSLDQVRDLIMGKQIQFGIRSERLYVFGWKKCSAFMVRTSLNSIGIQTGRVFNIDFYEDDLLELIVDSRISDLIKNKLEEYFSSTLTVMKGDILDPDFFYEIFDQQLSPKEIAELIKERNNKHLSRDTLPQSAKRYFTWHQKQVKEQLENNCYRKIPNPILMNEFIPPISQTNNNE